ncbi:MAG: PLP-dependent cysteine synthase family protein [Planctomycetota bacterium]
MPTVQTPYPTEAIWNEALAKLPQSALDLIGNTPLVHLRKISREFPGVVILGKLEQKNATGSVKVRPAARMVLAARAHGLLEGKTILDASSGNTAIALSFMGAVLGIPTELVVPANCSKERKGLIKVYGAKLIESSDQLGSDGAIELARSLTAENPGKYHYTDQYSNPENPLAHEHSTAVEIWNQTAGEVTHLVAGLGTSGTLMGTTRGLKKRNPQIRSIAVMPDDGMHGFEGLKHMPTQLVPAIYDPAAHDELIEMPTEEGWAMSERLVREEALFCGRSSGAALAAAVRIARRLRASHQRGVIVCILPDGGERYLDEYTA